jgi:glyceraldehyde 3-phosphate dehydrogenase
MGTRAAINGFGRIGRLVFRHFIEESVDVVAINDVVPLDNLAYLLRHDSVQLNPSVSIRSDEDTLFWGERTVKFFQERNPADLPWKENEIDVVIEATGLFTEREKAAQHLEAGARRVVISAPAKGADLTVCMGVNEEMLDPEKHTIISNASCTTNCLAPVAKVINDAFGIETGFLTTVHAVTSSQALVDAPAKKWTRGRSALANIVPTTTGAAVATTLVLPELEGKLDGLAMRVPVPVGSVIDFVVRTEKPVTVNSVNDAFKNASKTDRMRGILGVSDEPLVSSDIIGSTYSALVDADSTMTLGDRTSKVLAWYDNEWGYARRVVDVALYLTKMMRPV